METITVSDRREFVDEALNATIGDDSLSISKEGADELWRIWEYRYNNGATDDVLVFVPEWMADNDFGRRWPYLFASIEHDDEEKGAVLFSEARMIDPSVVENQVWGEVAISDVLETLDITDDNEYVDNAGHVWIARSQMVAFEMGQ